MTETKEAAIMERIAIWGTAAAGERVYTYLSQSDEWKVAAVSDRAEDKQGQLWHGLKIRSPEQIHQMAQCGELDGIVFAFLNQYQKDAAAIFKDCKKLKGYVIPTHTQKFVEVYDRFSLVEIDLSQPRLKQFDVNLVDHCNMKCKGCLRYSNLVDEPIYADFDQMICDWKRIKELFWGVERLKLMGGEPMLNPRLCDYIIEARKIFPDADIMVTTNALLINDNCQELFTVMKENGVFFDISLYRPVEENVSRLTDILDRNGVWYTLNYSKGNFYKLRSRTPDYDPDQAYEACTAKNCHHLREGKLSVCSTPQYAYVMNQRYNTQIPENSGVWDIYDLDMDAWELDRKLSHSFECCRYCAPPVEFQWDRADSQTAKMSDWFVDV